MMKGIAKSGIICIIVFLVLMLAHKEAIAQQTWTHVFGGSNYEEVRSIQQTSDRGYIVAGRTESFGAGYDDLWILKLNAIGISCSVRGNTFITPASTTSITPANSTATITTKSVTASDSTATIQSTTMSPVDLCTCRGTFGDVTSANPFCVYIEKLFAKGIAAGVVDGCSASPLNYCPTSLTQRQAMAKFICLGMNAANPGSCPTAACAGTFGDVTSSNPFCTYIEGLYTAGVVNGCTASPLNYCPIANTNKEQMAKFIVNGFALKTISEGLISYEPMILYTLRSAFAIS